MGIYSKQAVGVLVSDPETSYLLLERGETVGIGQIMRGAGVHDSVRELQDLVPLEHAHIDYPHYESKAVEEWKQAGCPYPPVYRIRVEAHVEQLDHAAAVRFWQDLADLRKAQDVGSEEWRAARGCSCDCDDHAPSTTCRCRLHEESPHGATT
jgi:hypothetical protein